MTAFCCSAILGYGGHSDERRMKKIRHFVVFAYLMYTSRPGYILLIFSLHFNAGCFQLQIVLNVKEGANWFCTYFFLLSHVINVFIGSQIKKMIVISLLPIWVLSGHRHARCFWWNVLTSASKKAVGRCYSQSGAP